MQQLNGEKNNLKWLKTIYNNFISFILVIIIIFL